MLVKKSSKNQIALPKAVLKNAGLGEDDVYFDISCQSGRIVLTPMTLEEKISPEALKRFEEKTLKREPGDREYPTMAAAIKGLRRASSR